MNSICAKTQLKIFNIDNFELLFPKLETLLAQFMQFRRKHEKNVANMQHC